MPLASPSSADPHAVKLDDGRWQAMGQESFESCCLVLTSPILVAIMFCVLVVISPLPDFDSGLVLDQRPKEREDVVTDRMLCRSHVMNNLLLGMLAECCRLANASNRMFRDGKQAHMLPITGSRRLVVKAPSLVKG